MASYFASLWKKGLGKLGNGLLNCFGWLASFVQRYFNASTIIGFNRPIIYHWTDNITEYTVASQCLASPAGVFRGDREEIRSPQKKPAGEATQCFALKRMRPRKTCVTDKTNWVNYLTRRFYWSVSSKWYRYYWMMCTVKSKKGYNEYNKGAWWESLSLHFNY